LITAKNAAEFNGTVGDDLMDDIPHNIAAVIRGKRRASGMTQADLAFKLGWSIVSIQNLERGRYKSPQLIRAALDFFDDPGPATPRPQVSEVRPTGHDWLAMPNRKWEASSCGPGALLDAAFEVVPFHGAGRKAELQSFLRWCHVSKAHDARIFKGAGGMGKTRFALELCRELKADKEAHWKVGFLLTSKFPEDGDPWKCLPDVKDSVAIIVDQASARDKIPVLGRLLDSLDGCPAKKVRILFLDRNDLWLGRLYTEPEGRRTLLGDNLRRGTIAMLLDPLAATLEERAESFTIAARAFQERLKLPKTGVAVPDLSKNIYKQVLFIHMFAVLAAYGTLPENKESSILSHILYREQEFWLRQMESQGISIDFLPAVQEAVYWVSVKDRVLTLGEAEAIVSKIRLLSGQPPLVIRHIVDVLGACYPSEDGGIAPLQPDILRDYLVDRMIRRK
jgi:DNA-binding XRE family transcriptional regulator